MKSFLIIHLISFIFWSTNVQAAAINPGHGLAAFNVDSRDLHYPVRPPPWPSSQLSEAPLDSAKVEQSTSDLEARQANHLTGPEYSVAYNYKEQGAMSTEIDPAPDNSAGTLVDEVTRSLLQDEKRAEDLLERKWLPPSRNPRSICNGRVCVPNRPTDKPRAIAVSDGEVSVHNNAEHSIEPSDIHASCDSDKARRTVPNGWIVTLRKGKSP
ncbi:hypothetical protein GQ607_002766 [Colletotrichum asianum]|uniref:Secreted protein n=1 Tax=Colletotrichum asianum TaxID=702518 RepID=A0A8H3WMD7_9PEZI|nr:hypothetical protein GQ607_002766 [Colletotrichum asianum]